MNGARTGNKEDTIGMFSGLGQWTSRHALWVCLVWLLLAGGLAWLAPNWDRHSHDDDIHFLPARCASVRGYTLLESAFPEDVYASRLILAVERVDAPLNQTDRAFVDRLAVALRRAGDSDPSLQIKKIVTFRDPFIGQRLLSQDGHCTLMQISLGTPYLALQTRTTVRAVLALVEAELQDCGDNPPQVYATGPAAIGRDLIDASANSLEATTLATILLVIVLLLAIYRSPLLALVPLLSIAMATWITMSLLALMTLLPGFHLVNISQIFAVIMLYGAGTDYCLFLISRYREELARGRPRLAALQQAVSGVGGALLASAATVICGLGLMSLAEFTKVRSSGPAIAVSLAVALAASLTLTPALLRLLGNRVFWPVGLPPRSQNPGESRFWGRFSYGVIARPFTVTLAALVVLLPLAVLGWTVRPSYRATAELSPSCDSVRGLSVIGRRFNRGELGPITVLLDSPSDWDSLAARRILELLTTGFSCLDNVAEVRSLTQPLGQPLQANADPVGQSRPLLSALWNKLASGIQDRVHQMARAFYLARRTDETGSIRHVTRLDIVLKSDPFDPASLTTLEAIQNWLREELPQMSPQSAEVRAEVYGVTVHARDMASVTESDRQRINTMVLLAIFAILLILVRDPVLAVYLLATVLLSYLATLGATTLLAHWLHGRVFGEIDWRVPFFLFTILVAVGEDYNILLISRALEERRRYGAIEGMRRALASTGGTITSCGLIMAGTFATLLLAQLHTLVQVGFALAFGVLLDAFLIRPLLVPAFTVWWWRLREPTLQQRIQQQRMRRAA
jgi:RND superfamily putative drug exporter